MTRSEWRTVWQACRRLGKVQDSWVPGFVLSPKSGLLGTSGRAVHVLFFNIAQERRRAPELNAVKPLLAGIANARYAGYLQKLP